MTDPSTTATDTETPEVTPHVPMRVSRAASSEDLLKADGFTRYLAEIRNYPLLTREEENAVATAFYEHDDVEAGRRLVTGNLRLVVKIAMEYRRAWVNVMDLIQEGNIGLSEAVKRYDPYRGVRFSSFARYWIRALILQYILKNFRMVSFSSTRAGRKLFFRLEKERNRLMQAFGEATTKMLADNLEVSEDDVVAATVMRQAPMSFSSPRGSDGEGRTLSDVLPDQAINVESEVVKSQLMATVDEHMQVFAETLADDRERAIWTERLIAEDPIALAALGTRFGVSRERIRQIEARIKKRLKKHLTDALGDGLKLDFAQD
jgi:RNA polymerase sigma-32 factor